MRTGGRFDHSYSSVSPGRALRVSGIVQVRLVLPGASLGSRRSFVFVWVRPESCWVLSRWSGLCG